MKKCNMCAHWEIAVNNPNWGFCNSEEFKKAFGKDKPFSHKTYGCRCFEYPYEDKKQDAKNN